MRPLLPLSGVREAPPEVGDPGVEELPQLAEHPLRVGGEGRGQGGHVVEAALETPGGPPGPLKTFQGAGVLRLGEEHLVVAAPQLPEGRSVVEDGGPELGLGLRVDVDPGVGPRVILAGRTVVRRRRPGSPSPKPEGPRQVVDAVDAGDGLTDPVPFQDLRRVSLEGGEGAGQLVDGGAAQPKLLTAVGVEVVETPASVGARPPHPQEGLGELDPGVLEAPGAPDRQHP